MPKHCSSVKCYEIGPAACKVIAVTVIVSSATLITVEIYVLHYSGLLANGNVHINCMMM